MTPRRIFGRRRRALVCRDAVDLVTDYLEGSLPARQQALLEQHLATCPHCTTYVAQIRATRAALGRVEVDELPRETVDGLLALYRSYLSGS